MARIGGSSPWNQERRRRRRRRRRRGGGGEGGAGAARCCITTTCCLHGTSKIGAFSPPRPYRSNSAHALGFVAVGVWHESAEEEEEEEVVAAAKRRGNARGRARDVSDVVERLCSKNHAQRNPFGPKYNISLFGLYTHRPAGRLMDGWIQKQLLHVALLAPCVRAHNTPRDVSDGSRLCMNPAVR